MSMIWKNVAKPFFVLAPMDDVTDTVFRQIVSQCAPPDLYFTEFVNVDGLQSPGRPALMPKIRFTESEHPVIAQVWGKKPDNYYQTAKDLVAMGFDGIDINMGCPVKEVVNNGCCTALINDRDLAGAIIEATKKGAQEAGAAAGRQVPVSVKTRLGFNEVDYTWHEFLLQQGLDALTVHGRTRKEMSAVPARWDDIAHVRELRDQIAPQTVLVGNGDVLSRQHGLDLQAQSGVDGIMIGRGIFHDPYIFSEQSPWAETAAEQRIDLYRRHIQLFVDTWQNGERKLHTLNKFCKVYINGFDGAKELRDQLMHAETAEALLTILAKPRS